MTGKFVAILMLLCVSQLTFGDDLQTVKKNALKKLESITNEFFTAYSKSCDIFHKRPLGINPMREKQRDLGESLWEMSIMEVNQTVLEIKQKARLVKESPKVNECVQTKAEETLNRLKKSYEDYFKALDNSHAKALEKYYYIVDKWSNGYYDLRARLIAQEDIAIEEIQSTNNKAYVAQIVAGYEKRMPEWVKGITLEPMLKAYEINFDRTLQNGPVKAFRAYTRKIVDDFIQSVNKCFALV